MHFDGATTLIRWRTAPPAGCAGNQYGPTRRTSASVPPAVLNPSPRRHLRPPRRLLQRLIEAPEDVVEALDADREADHVGAHSGRDLLFVGELAVGRRAGMDDQGLGVPDVGEVAHELRRFDERLARVPPPADAEGEDRARALGQVLLRQGVVGARFEARIIDPAH